MKYLDIIIIVCLISRLCKPCLSFFFYIEYLIGESKYLFGLKSVITRTPSIGGGRSIESILYSHSSGACTINIFHFYAYLIVAFYRAEKFKFTSKNFYYRTNYNDFISVIHHLFHFYAYLIVAFYRAEKFKFTSKNFYCRTNHNDCMSVIHQLFHFYVYLIVAFYRAEKFINLRFKTCTFALITMIVYLNGEYWKLLIHFDGY